MARRSISAGPSVTVRLGLVLAGDATKAAALCDPPVNLGQYVELAVREKLDRQRGDILTRQWLAFNKRREEQGKYRLHRHEWEDLRGIEKTEGR